MKNLKASLVTSRAAFVLLALSPLMAQAVVLPADASRTREAADQAPHESSRNRNAAVAATPLPGNFVREKEPGTDFVNSRESQYCL
jgi:hypothetical protein